MAGGSAGLEVTVDRCAVAELRLVRLGDDRADDARAGPNRSPSSQLRPRHTDALAPRCVALNSAMDDGRRLVARRLSCPRADSQAIIGWNGAGSVPDPEQLPRGRGAVDHVRRRRSGDRESYVPSDITDPRQRHDAAAAWKGPSGPTKTIFETKNARRVLVEGNVIENVWADAQVGYSVLLKSRTRTAVRRGRRRRTSRSATTASARRRRVQHRRAPGEVSGHESAARFTIYDNTLDSLNVGVWTGPGIGLQVLGDVADVIYAHNSTTAPSGNSATLVRRRPNTRFVMHSNVSTQARLRLRHRQGRRECARSSSTRRWPVANNVLVGSTNCGVYIRRRTCSLAAWPTTPIAGFDGRASLARISRR
jgi:hypothetical protein